MSRVHNPPVVTVTQAASTATLCGVLTVAAGLCFAGPANAQTLTASQSADASADATVPEITVTAQKRATNLQETPIAITAFSAQQIEDQHLTTLRDLAGQVPGLSIPRGGITPTTQLFYLRGIGEGDPIFDPAIALYVDDVYIPRSIGGLSDLTDLDRVEVLRGPQGTLYGRNTSAGAIRLISHDPGNDTRASADIGVGDWGAFEAHGYLSGAIVENKLYASLTYSHRQHDGYTYDPTISRDVNDLDVDSARLKIRATPTDNLDIQLTVDGSRDRSSTAYYTPKVQPGGTFDPQLSFVSNLPQNDDDTAGVSLREIYTINDHLSAKSITAYRGFSQAPVSYDNDGLAAVQQVNYIHYHESEVTQEFQLNGDYGPVNFTSGIFFLHENFSSNRNGFTFPSAANPPQDQVGATKTNSEAVYTQGTYKFDDQLSGTLGLRYTHEQRDFTYAQFDDTLAGVPLQLLSGAPAPAPVGANPAGPFAASSSASWDSLTPKYAVQYQWTPDLLQYASISRGFKAGGFDNRANVLANAEIPYAPEKVTTYETGVKSEWFDRRLRANAALFYNDYTNLQQTAFDPGVPGRSRRLNAGSAHTDGIELETTAVPTAGLQWNASAAYTFATYDRFANPFGLGTSANGNRLPFAPRWTANTSISYVVPLDIPGSVRLGADAQYQTKSFADVANSWQIEVPSQKDLGSFLSYATEDGHWSATLSVRNLLDQQENQAGSYSKSALGTIWTYLENPPRTVFLKLKYDL